MNVGDLTSSKQAIKNNMESHNKTSLEYKMQDTENFPILRTYKNYVYLSNMIGTEPHYKMSDQ